MDTTILAALLPEIVSAAAAASFTRLSSTCTIEHAAFPTDDRHHWSPSYLPNVLVAHLDQSKDTRHSHGIETCSQQYKTPHKLV